jgi:stage IV sporulation protein FB
VESEHYDTALTELIAPRAAPMKLPEPGHVKYEFQGHLLGAAIRIHPLFWCSAAALGVRYFADPENGSIGYFVFWMAGVSFCVLLHALGEIFVGRIFGMRGEILLYGLGGRTTGVESLPRCRKRITVLLAGPIVLFLLVAGLWGITESVPFPDFLIDWGWQTPIANGAAILVRIGLYWGLLNVLPLWPLAGGQIAVDLGETFFGKRGRTIALVSSLGVIAYLCIWTVFQKSYYLGFHYDPHYLLHLVEGFVLLVFCYVLWMLNFKVLWQGNQPSSGNADITTAHSGNATPRITN